MKRIIQTLLFIVLAAQFSMAQPPKWLDKSKRAVFSVVTYGNDGQMLKSGNGFFVTESGVGVSDYELFRGASKAEIITSDGKKMPIESILGANELYDVIKFKVAITEKKVQALPIATQAPAVDAKVFMLPYSTQKEMAFKSGTIKEVAPIETKYHYYTLNLSVTDKQLSSPVTNTEGQVIGLIQPSSGADADKVCYAVGVNFIMAQQLSPLNLNSSSMKSIGIRKGLPENEEEALIFLFIASSQLSEEDYLMMLNDFIAQYPKNAEGYSRRAILRAYTATSKADYQLAADDFAKALSLATNKGDVNYALAKQMYQYALSSPEVVYEPWGLEQAMNEVNKAIQIEPLGIYLQLAGDIAFAQRDYATSFDFYNKVNNTEMASSTSFFNAAKAKELQGGQPEEIIALLDSAIARSRQPIGEDEAPYLLERAQQYMNAGNYRMAVVDYDSYFTAAAGNVNDVFYYLREQAALNARQYQRALDDIAMAIQMNPSEVAYKIEQAVINLRVGRYDEAVSQLKEVIKMNPEDGEAYRLLGICQVQLKDVSGACASFAKAKELGDEFVDELIKKHCN